MGLKGGSDHPLGRTPRPPRLVGPVLPPHRPYRTIRSPPGQDSLSAQAGVPGSTSPQALQDTPTTARKPLPPGSRAVHCRSCTAHCPQAMRQCIAEVPPPTAPGQWGSALQELHCPLPPGSEAVHCRSCTAHCPQGSEAVHCRSCTAYCPRAVRQCIAGVALPTAPRQ